MKKGLHPENYRPVVFKDMSNGDMFLTKSTCNSKETIEFEGETYPLIKVEISSSSHPFYTGKSKLVDTAGRVEGFKLITRIQDEAHRFAIEYHRSLRNKNEVKSVLDDIPGVGPSRRKALMRSFDSIDEVKEASVERLMGVDGITKNVAESIHYFFHKEN